MSFNLVEIWLNVYFDTCSYVSHYSANLAQREENMLSVNVLPLCSLNSSYCCTDPGFCHKRRFCRISWSLHSLICNCHFSIFRLKWSTFSFFFFFFLKKRCVLLRFFVLHSLDGHSFCLWWSWSCCCRGGWWWCWCWWWSWRRGWRRGATVTVTASGYSSSFSSSRVHPT